MPRKTHNHRLDLPPLELDCMKTLWRLGQGTVHDIRSSLLGERPLAYNTVLTVMDHLARKGMVRRDRRGRAHLYHPLVAENMVRDRAIDRLTRSFFSGSRDRLRQYLEAPGAPLAGSLASAATEKARAEVAVHMQNIDPALL